MQAQREIKGFTLKRAIADGGPLKIGLYSPALPDSGVSNGIVTYTRIMRDALRAIGHSVVVVTVDAIEHADGQVREIPKPRALFRQIRMFQESFGREDASHPYIRIRVLDAFRAARRAGVQVFEMEESFGWAGRLAGRGVAIVERLHGPHFHVRDQIETSEEKRIGDLRQAAEFASFAKVQAVTAPTQRLLDSMILQGLDPKIVRAIPNPMPVAPKDLIWRLDRANPDQILFVGRFDLCKGADVAINAFARAAKRKPSLKLIVVGPDRGLSSEDGHKVHFEEFLAANVPIDVQNRIEFLGEQAPARIAELRLQSGFALVASRFETFPYALTEAMASGMPVLSSNCLGPSEMILDGINGRLVPVGNVLELADAMLEMAGDHAALSQMGGAAYSWAASRLSPDRAATEAVAVYREAISRL